MFLYVGIEILSFVKLITSNAILTEPSTGSIYYSKTHFSNRKIISEHLLDTRLNAGEKRY